MSGIPSSGAGDVKLAGDPNAFTGTNTFDVNRPTSTLTSTISATDFLTKQNADTLYTGSAGDVQEGGNNVFTGTNTFNSNRPTSTLTSTIAATDFITKQNADTLYTNNTGDAVLAGANAFTSTNTFNTNRPTSTITSTPASTDLITKQNADALYGSGSGDALLAGGTSGSRQTFTGFNTFTNDLTMSGAVGIGNRADIDMLGDKAFIQQSATIQNKLLQNGASNEIDQNGTNNVISQSGLNALITTSGKMTCATAPTSGSDLCNKTYVDGVGAGFALLAAGTAANPQEFTGVCDFNGGSLQMTNPLQTFSMIQLDTATSDVNTFAMTGVRNRITQNGLSNATINEFKQSGGSNTASSISQFTPDSLIYQDSTTAKLITKGRIGIGLTAVQTPIAPLEIQGSATSLNNGSNYGYLRNNNPSSAYSAGWGAFGLSIKTSNIIFAGNYVLASDERIKRDITDLSNTLVLIDKIKPKTYKYRDTAEGDRMTYGFIAQELEQVIPEAVITTRNKIPNIMKKTNVIDGVFILEETTDLIEGDVIAIYDDENKQYDVTITEMISDKSFKIDMVEDLQDQFFIYGKFVDDFKAIEHNDLLPVMIKGIQELNAKNKSLEERLAILEAKINNMP